MRRILLTHTARREWRILEAYERGEWDTVPPPCSTSEQVTIALALQRVDLLPDPLPRVGSAEQLRRLDSAQRNIVQRWWLQKEAADNVPARSRLLDQNPPTTLGKDKNGDKEP